MKFPKNDFKVLQNFSVINQGIVVDESKCFKTSSDNASLLGFYDTEEEYQEFSLWSLPTFINIINTFGIENAEIEFEPENKNIKIKNKNSSIDYEYLDNPSLIPAFNKIKKSSTYKKLEFSGFDFDLSFEDIKEIKKINNIFSFSESRIHIKMEDGKGRIKVYSNKKEQKNNYEQKIEGNGTGEFICTVDDFKIIDGNYRVQLNDDIGDGIIKLSNKDMPLFYLIVGFEK